LKGLNLNKISIEFNVVETPYYEMHPRYEVARIIENLARMVEQGELDNSSSLIIYDFYGEVAGKLVVS
jgi:hypothetical protein